MPKRGKPDATGRSSGKQPGRRGAVLKPPPGEPWAWITREVLSSPSWRALSANGRRLMDFLILEHMSHGGQENGNLIATHDQLRAYGLSANSIRPAIEEAAFLGLICYQQGGRRGETNQPTVFRVTFYGVCDGNGIPPTNDWKRLTEEQIRAWKEEKKEQNQGKRAKKQKAALKSESTVPSNQRVPEGSGEEVSTQNCGKHDVPVLSK